ncbi:ankyrin repeat domain-containing protein, partial [Candidatus Dependentiae bacterium]
SEDILIFSGFGLDLNAKDKFGNSLLHTAVIGKNFRAVKYLLYSGANVNIQNACKQTPLNLAVKTENIDLAKLLMSFGADSKIKDKNNKTPIYLAKNLKSFENLFCNVDLKLCRYLHNPYHPFFS